VYTFSTKQIKIATEADLPNIVGLLNAAYRGDESRKGWTTEADLIHGNVRTTLHHVQEILEKKNSIFLVFNQDKEIIGCVNLQLHDNRVYLGMFAVLPTKQGGGTGKLILLAAEEWARYKNATAIYMTVITLRSELIAWYTRFGYVDTNRRIPFEEDGYSGRHSRRLEFAELEKKMASKSGFLT
jgi:N-acetylglutamate synthase-like GNAT family acetyltransferase